MLKTKLLVVCALVCANITTSFSQNMNVELRSQLTFAKSGGGVQTLANIGGYVDEAGNEYALVGAEQGLVVVDITDPDNPVVKVQIAGPDNLWREVKVYKDYAYVTTEASGTGLQIIDLSPLPGSSVLPNHYWNGGSNLGSIHSLHIDTTKGFVYCFGSNIGNGGAFVGDLNADPYNPTYTGSYDFDGYVHDGFVDNDTLYACHIYTGVMSIVDMTNKSNPVVINTQVTPGAFVHNCWPSLDRKYVFTTDEVCNSYVTAYDISDLMNIKEVDRIQTNPDTPSIVHNTHVRGKFAVTSWYKDGFSIVDISHPETMVQVGKYDLDVSESGCGYGGTWGVYPFFPSGNIVASNLYDGHFSVLTPNYVHASFLKGSITDCSGVHLNGVHVHVLGTGDSTITDFTGSYAIGDLITGNYTVQFSKPGYPTQTVAVNFISGYQQIVNLVLDGTATNFVGLVVDSLTNNPIANAQVLFTKSSLNMTVTTDNNGHFSTPKSCDGTYDVYAGEWGHIEKEIGGVVLNSSNDSIHITLKKGYADDFLLDLGWATTGSTILGSWQRGDPEGTSYAGDPAQPENDLSNDLGAGCYATGLAGGLPADDNDVDLGATVLTSPTMDLSNYSDPYIAYSRWFFDGGSSPNDQISIYLTDGVNNYPVENLYYSFGMNSWNQNAFRVLDYAPSLTSPLQLVVTTEDVTPENIVEGAFDNFFVQDSIIPPLPPEAAFTSNEVGICPGSSIQFTDQSANGPTQWNWSMPGATPDTSNLQNPMVVYDSSGHYDVTLMVTNGVGSTTVTHQNYILVYEPPTLAAGTITPDNGTNNGTASVTIVTGSAPYAYLWSNGATTNPASGLAAGNYVVTVTDFNGCSDTLAITVLSTGIATLDGSNFISIYPNPFEQSAEVKYNLGTLHTSDNYLSVVNVIGHEVQRIQLKTSMGTISIGQKLDEGIYFINLVNNGEKYSSVKLIKAK